MKILPLTNIKSIEDVECFFKHLIEVEKLSMHPDTPFLDYTDEEGNIFYSAEEVKARDNLMDEAFTVCEETQIDVYVVGQVILLEHLHGK